LIGDYLRDAATSEATVVNLKLQSLVIVLTIVAALIAVVALIPGSLTEEQKKNSGQPYPRRCIEPWHRLPSRCRRIEPLPVGINCGFKFKKRSQLFFRSHNEPPSVVAMRVSNPDCSAFGING
jgi:hypothetical protein